MRKIIARENVIRESAVEKMLLSEDGFREFCFREICRLRKCFRESIVQYLISYDLTNVLFSFDKDRQVGCDRRVN